MLKCSSCNRPISAAQDICPCGAVANRDKRKRRHGKSGKVKLRPYGHGETPQGKFISYTLGNSTIRLEIRKADYLRIQGIRRGCHLVVSYPAASEPRVLYISDIASKARAAFQAARLEMLSCEARGFKKRAYRSAANRFRAIACLEPLPRS